jgi:F0F1-type ATP synthase membrane subunit b/b'
MSLLLQLGINETVFIQFLLYTGVFTFLALYVFTPYAKAAQEREFRTKGTEELVLEYQRKSTELHSQYETRVREIHHHIQEIYRQLKQETTVEYERIVGQARLEAQQSLEAARKSLQTALAATTAELHSQTANLSMAITNKILGK